MIEESKGKTGNDINPETGNFVLEDSKEIIRESLPYAKRVAKLFEIGISATDLYAWHGTSVEAIIYLAKHGKLPSTGRITDELYYVPEGIGSREGDQQHAEHYAGWNAKKFYIMERLSFEWHDMEILSSISEGDYSEADEFFARAHENGMTDKAVLKLVRDASERKGVVLTLSQKIKDDYIETPQGDGDEVSIKVDGLPIDYITGIEALGQYEYDIMEEIQRNAEKDNT